MKTNDCIVDYIPETMLHKYIGHIKALSATLFCVVIALLIALGVSYNQSKVISQQQEAPAVHQEDDLTGAHVNTTPYTTWQDWDESTAPKVEYMN